jgi:hypothetical protein
LAGRLAEPDQTATNDDKGVHYLITYRRWCLEIHETVLSTEAFNIPAEE